MKYDFFKVEVYESGGNIFVFAGTVQDTEEHSEIHFMVSDENWEIILTDKYSDFGKEETWEAEWQEKHEAGRIEEKNRMPFVKRMLEWCLQNADISKKAKQVFEADLLMLPELFGLNNPVEKHFYRFKHSILLKQKNRPEKYRKPIYELFLFENPEKELIYPSGKHSGFPDIGASDTIGYYYDLEDAIEDMHTNACDIRETVYDAGFIFCRFPGLYDAVDSERRLYFVWDDEKGGYFEKEEPKLFRHIAY